MVLAEEECLYSSTPNKKTSSVLLFSKGTYEQLSRQPQYKRNANTKVGTDVFQNTLFGHVLNTPEPGIQP